MKKIISLICILLLIAVPVTVIAINSGGDQASGGFERIAVDRMDIRVDHTDFILRQTDDDRYTVKFTVKLAKTQPDFYAYISSFDFIGMEYESLLFTPLNDAYDGNTLSGLTLTFNSEEANEAVYEATLTFTPGSSTYFEPKIVLDYTSGMTMITSESHMLEIPFSIQIEP